MPQQEQATWNSLTETLVTVLTSVDPPVIGKTFDIIDGELKALRRSSNIRRAIASTELTTENITDFAQLLRQVSAQTNSVIVPGLFNGDTDGEPFSMITESELSSLTGLPIGAPEFSTIQNIGGQRYAARLKRAISPSCWMLFDFDRGVPGMPSNWRDINIHHALQWLEPILPGISDAGCITYRSSSSRVIGPNRPLGQPSHAWVRVQQPYLIEQTMRALQVRGVLNNLAFRSPRYSQSTGAVIGEQWRGLFDWSVLIPGRIVFTSCPILTPAAQAAGYSIAPAGVAVALGGTLDLSAVPAISSEELMEYERATGIGLRFSGDGGSSSVHVSGILDYETPITIRGHEEPFGSILQTMRVGETIRCEAPFRDSTSEAAFIRCTAPNNGFVYDIGVGETYTMTENMVAERNIASAAEVGQALSRRVHGVERTQVNNQRVEREIVQHQADAALPTIMVDKERPEAAARALMPLLKNIQHQPLWSVSGYMVYVDGSKLISVDRSDPRHKVPTLGTVKINGAHLLEMIPQVANLMVFRGRNIVSVKPSNDIINILLNSPDVKDHLPIFRGVVGTPFMREDGTICSAEGYDEASGMWLQTALDVHVDDPPTGDDARDALALLRGLLTEMHFPEVNDDGSPTLDETIALCALMGVVLRPAFEAMPAVIINGTAAGAGKSYFTKLLGVLSTGRDPAMLSWPRRAEELDKLLDSLLYNGVSMIAFDNANGVKVGGQKICSIVSESEIAGRLLGATQTIRLSTRATSMIINGNRVEAREDFAARALTMQLAPNVVVARDVHFQGSPLTAVRNNRALYVRAVLTIARWWRVMSFERNGNLPVWNGFDGWSNTIRSALAALGCPDPVEVIRAAVVEDDELTGVTALVRAAHAFRPDGSPWKVAEFVAYLVANSEVAAVVREAIDPDDEAGVARLGRLVGDWLRHRAAGRTIELADGSMGVVERVRGNAATVKWKVVNLS